MEDVDIKQEEKRFYAALIMPVFFMILVFTIRLVEDLESFSLVEWGIRPLSIEGLPGILLAPLIHSDWTHFFANAVPFMVLGVSLFYFYRGIAIPVFVFVYLMSGIWVWLGARDAWHIGASGMIYGLAAFLVTSGVIRNHIPLLAISLIVVFLYGGMIWGVFPLKWNVPYSWESHLWGSIAGLALAVIYRNKGPQKQIKQWPEEEYESPYWENEAPE